MQTEFRRVRREVIVGDEVKNFEAIRDCQDGERAE